MQCRTLRLPKQGNTLEEYEDALLALFRAVELAPARDDYRRRFQNVLERARAKAKSRICCAPDIRAGGYVSAISNKRISIASRPPCSRNPHNCG